MANICDNTFFASSENSDNLNYIEKFLYDNLQAECDRDDNYINAYFDSKWVFPEELMNEMYNGLPDKEDIYMHCLSVEYGCLYHALHVCDCRSNGWYDT